MDWKWAEGSVLYSYSSKTPCKDLYNAVCYELARYFKDKGFKHLKSKRRLIYQDEQIKLEIVLWTSSNNTRGDYVVLEIYPEFCSVKFKDICFGGIMFGHTKIYDRNRIPKPWGTGGWSLDNFRFNCYGFTIKDFKEVVSLIENKILPWIYKLKKEDGVREMILRLREDNKNWNFNNRGYLNTVFPEYIVHYFPELAKEMAVI